MSMQQAMQGLYQPEHLGDGLYAAHDQCGLWLKAEREGMIHEVYLEPWVLQALNRYWERIKPWQTPAAETKQD